MKIVKEQDNSQKAGFHILTRNPKSINSFTQNGNNNGIITSTINSSRPSQIWENGDQLSENQENKSLYPDCALVIRGLFTLSYRNNNNNIVWHVKRLALFNMISYNLGISLSSESDFSRWIVWVICSRTSKWMTFCPSWKRQGFTKKYDELKPFNCVRTNEILLI